MSDASPLRDQPDTATAPPSYMGRTSDYGLVRVKDMVHREACRYAKSKNALVWLYPDNRPGEDWKATSTLKACMVCDPPSPAEKIR